MSSEVLTQHLVRLEIKHLHASISIATDAVLPSE